MAPTLVLVSGPLDAPGWWDVATPALSSFDLPVTAPQDLSDGPLFGVSWIASVAQSLHASGVDGPLVMVAHGCAGPLLPALARTQRAGGRQIGAYVFVDATLPRPGPTTHLDLLRAAAPAEADRAHDRLHEPGGTWPEEPAPSGVRPRDHQFWTETLPPAIDWPDAPCAYVRTGEPAAGCGDTAFWARSARSRGWPVTEDADVVSAVRQAIGQLPG